MVSKHPGKHSAHFLIGKGGVQRAGSDFRNRKTAAAGSKRLQQVPPRDDTGRDSGFIREDQGLVMAYRGIMGSNAISQRLHRDMGRNGLRFGFHHRRNSRVSKGIGSHFNRHGNPSLMNRCGHNRMAGPQPGDQNCNGAAVANGQRAVALPVNLHPQNDGCDIGVGATGKERDHACKGGQGRGNRWQADGSGDHGGQ